VGVDPFARGGPAAWCRMVVNWVATGVKPRGNRATGSSHYDGDGKAVPVNAFTRPSALILKAMGHSS